MSAQDLAAIFQDWEHERPKYARGWRFYQGLQGEFFASRRARQLLQKAGVEDMDRMNFAAIVVDTIIDRLHISGVSGQGKDVADLVGKVTRENELEQEEQVWLQYLGAMGEAISVVLPADDDEQRPSGVSVAYWDPRRARVLYDALDPLKKIAGVLTWPLEKTTRADLYYADGRLERWVGKAGRDAQGKLKDAALWEPWEGEDADGNELPAEETLDFEDTGLPFFHYRTGRPEAQPLHRKAYGPQQAIDKIVVSHLATVDVASFPQRYGQIDPAADQMSAGTSVNPFHPGMGEDDDPESEANSSQLSADPGALWKLRGYTGVGQFAVASAEVFMAPLDRYVRAMAQVTRIPMHYFDPSGDAPSGESLKVSDAPINHKVDALKVNCGAVAEDQWAAVLAFAGAGSDIVVNVRWAPHETATDLASWQTVAAKVANNVPVRVSLIEAGYDPEDVDSWLEDLDDSGEIGRQVALLGQLGDALLKIAQAEALGVKADTADLITTVTDAMAALWPGSSGGQ